MAQSDEVELRDLVIDALDKNGSLPKIRALLRANIFLAFEEECENIKQNPVLDSILQTQEGLLTLSLVHEFLEFCNLRNTMFVYVSESRQGKEYKYEGRKRLSERFMSLKRDVDKEPILISILKAVIASHAIPNDNVKKKPSSFLRNGLKVDENCTYIVHEDSSSLSSQSNSNSDKSSDEKTKSRLSLDNSDTDTSSDSTRDKSSSEYIANENIIVDGDSDNDSKKSLNTSYHKDATKPKIDVKYKTNCEVFNLHDSGLINLHTSSDSTSYLDLHTFKNNRSLDTTKINKKNVFENNFIEMPTNNQSTFISSTENKSSSLKSSGQPESISNEKSKKYLLKNLEEGGGKEIPTSDYSNDFTSSPASVQDSKEIRNEDINGNSPNVKKSPKEVLSSSHSSISVSDVADLIDLDSSNSPIKEHNCNSDDNISNSVKNKLMDIKNTFKKTSTDDSDDSIVSSIPSLSNLSLDFHSEERL